MKVEPIKESSKIGRGRHLVQATRSARFESGATVPVEDSNSAMQSHESTNPPMAAKSPPAPNSRRLSNNAINFIVDAVMLIAFMVVLTLAAIVQFVFPTGGSAAGWSLWSHDRSDWQTALSVSIAVFGLLVLLHLILHWSWVCTFVTSRLSKATGRRTVLTESARTLWGVAFLIAVLTGMGAALAIAEFCVITGGK